MASPSVISHSFWTTYSGMISPSGSSRTSSGWAFFQSATCCIHGTWRSGEGCSFLSSVRRWASTHLASPTMGMSTSTFFEISAGSMSTWMIVASGAKLSSLPVTRSSNRTPTAEDQVAVGDGVVGVHRPVHAQHAERELVVLGEGTDARQRVRDRDVGVQRQLAQLGRGVGRDDARRPRRSWAARPRRWPSPPRGSAWGAP